MRFKFKGFLLIALAFSSCGARNNVNKIAVRFTVASDVHHGFIVDSLDRLENLYDFSYDFASKDGKKLDAVFHCGDIIDYYDVNLFKEFKATIDKKTRIGTTTYTALGGHEYKKSVSEEETKKTFESIFKIPLNNHIEINGFDFIYIAHDGDLRFDDATLNWLDNELSKCSKKSDKPIFVFQHAHPKNTVYGSQMWGIESINKVLDKYHQVVDFSGHSHFPISDPRSIYQKNFTALGTGCLSFYEVGINNHYEQKIFPLDFNGSYDEQDRIRDGYQFYIVDVYRNGDIKVHCCDLKAKKVFKTIDIKNPYYKKNFIYTDERYKNSEAPYFKKDNPLILMDYKKKISIAFIKAESKDNVEHYELNIKNDSGFNETILLLSDTFYCPSPDCFTRMVDVTESGDYTVSLTAYNSFKVPSKTYTDTITIA